MMKRFYLLLLLLPILNSCNEFSKGFKEGFDNGYNSEKELSLSSEKLGCEAFSSELKEVLTQQQLANLDSLRESMATIDDAFIKDLFTNHTKVVNISTTKFDEAANKCECEAKLQFELDQEHSYELIKGRLEEGISEEEAVASLEKMSKELPLLDVQYSVHETAEADFELETAGLGEELEDVLIFFYTLEAAEKLEMDGNEIKLAY